MRSHSNKYMLNMSLDEYGRALESDLIVSLDERGFIIDIFSGNLLSANGEQLDLLIAYMGSLRERMNWIGPYISIHFLSLNPLLVRRRRYSRGERYPSALCGCHSL